MLRTGQSPWQPARRAVGSADQAKLAHRFEPHAHRYTDENLVPRLSATTRWMRCQERTMPTPALVLCPRKKNRRLEGLNRRMLKRC